jgi:hypothetical protein
MTRYLVIGSNPVRALVVFSDELGQSHVAHCTGTLPTVGSSMTGFPAAVRGALLLDEKHNVVRVMFHHVCCSQRRALELMLGDDLPAQAQQQGL